MKTKHDLNDGLKVGWPAMLAGIIAGILTEVPALELHIWLFVSIPGAAIIMAYSCLSSQSEAEKGLIEFITGLLAFFIPLSLLVTIATMIPTAILLKAIIRFL